jgi:hypothetical protein|tara:strand:- start:2026 stop:2265 length:240 start_codon:yes stop_codon:yes gene_type:complete
MKKFDDFMNRLRSVLLKSAESMGLIIVVLIMIYLLLGEASGPIVIGVVANVSLFVSAVTPQALIGAALIIGVIYYYRDK